MHFLDQNYHLICITINLQNSAFDTTIKILSESTFDHIHGCVIAQKQCYISFGCSNDNFYHIYKQIIVKLLQICADTS